MFIKTIFKESRKLKRIRNYVSKSNLYLDVSRTQEVCHVIHIFFERNFKEWGPF